MWHSFTPFLGRWSSVWTALETCRFRSPLDKIQKSPCNSGPDPKMAEDFEFSNFSIFMADGRMRFGKPPRFLDCELYVQGMPSLFPMHWLIDGFPGRYDWTSNNGGRKSQPETCEELVQFFGSSNFEKKFLLGIYFRIQRLRSLWPHSASRKGLLPKEENWIPHSQE